MRMSDGGVESGVQATLRFLVISHNSEFRIPKFFPLYPHPYFWRRVEMSKRNQQKGDLA